MAVKKRVRRKNGGMTAKQLIAITTKNLRAIGPLKPEDHERSFAKLNQLIDEWGSKPLKF